MSEAKYNYTYKLTLKSDPRYYYYGVHSTNKNPEKDRYFGSGTEVLRLQKEQGKTCFNKEILEFFPTREQVLSRESQLVTEEVLQDPFCLNRIVGGGKIDYAYILQSPKVKEARVKARQEHYKNHSDSTKKLIALGKQKYHAEVGPMQWIFKGSKSTVVPKDELQKYLDNGYSVGRNLPKESKQNIGKNSSGTWITDGKEERRVKDMTGVREGWKVGRKKASEETRGKLRQANLGKTLSEYTKKLISSKLQGIKRGPWTEERRKKHSLMLKGRKGTTTGRIWIHKGSVQKSVDPKELEQWIDRGYEKGKKETTAIARENISRTHKGRFYINNGVQSKMIYEKDWDQYKQEGWVKGRGKRSWN